MSVCARIGPDRKIIIFTKMAFNLITFSIELYSETEHADLHSPSGVWDMDMNMDSVLLE